MKIRNGFVSNSSSSSFCIYGVAMETEEVIEKIQESLTQEEKDQLEEEGDYMITEIIEDKADLSVYESEGSIWIGREWSSIKDDETGAQFKANVKAEIEKFLGPGMDCGTHEEEIYN